jgi:hypothetical protein
VHLLRHTLHSTLIVINVHCRVIFARRAFDYTQQTIDALKIVQPAELQWVSIGMLAAAIAFGVCLGISLLLAMWRGRISSHVDDEGEGHHLTCMQLSMDSQSIPP